MAVLIQLIPIALIILFIYATFKILFQKKVPNNTVIAFTGGLGSGKTYLGVKYALKHYRKMRFLYFLRIIKDEPMFFSNIPIRITRKKWAIKLEYDHLTLKSRLPEYSTVFIDELGQIASQYDFNNPYVMQYLQEFIRFFRHYVDGKLIVTDQTSSNIVVAIRRRINQIYNLYDFKRWFFFWYMVNVNEVMITEDITNIKDVSDDTPPYFMGYLPFKYVKILNYLNPFYLKHYDSRTYSINYHAKIRLNHEPWALKNSPLALKTDYFIELPNIKELKTMFQRDGFVPHKLMTLHMEQFNKKKKVIE